MKYLKAYNRNSNRDIRKITKLDYIIFINERSREAFTEKEIDQISDLTGMAEMHARGSEMDCMDSGEISIFIYKFSDEWFIILIDEVDKDKLGDWKSHYYLCDQFDSVLKFIKEVVDEVY